MRNPFLLLLAFLLIAPALARPRLEIASRRWSGAGDALRLEVTVSNRGPDLARGVLCVVYLGSEKVGQLSSPADLPAQKQMLLEGTLQLSPSQRARLEGKEPGQALRIELSAQRIADLAVTDIAVEQAALGGGQGVRWLVTVVNQGLAPAASIPYRLLRNGENVFQKKQLDALGPGEARTLVYLDRSTWEGARHKLECLIDPEQELEDSNLTNNRYTLQWSQASSRPDLSVRNWNIEDKGIQVGTPVRLIVSVTNQGDIDLYRVPLSLQVNGETEVEKKFFQALAPEGEADFQLAWVPRRAGEHQLRLVCQGVATPPRSVHVEPRPGYRLQIVSSNIPKISRLDKDWIFELEVSNAGTLPCEAPRAVLTQRGSRLWSASLGPSLAPGQVARIQLRWTAERPGKQELKVEISGQGARADEAADVEQMYPIEVEGP